MKCTMVDSGNSTHQFVEPPGLYNVKTNVMLEWLKEVVAAASNAANSNRTGGTIRVVRVELLANLASVCESLSSLLNHLACTFNNVAEPPMLSC